MHLLLSQGSFISYMNFSSCLLCLISLCASPQNSLFPQNPVYPLANQFFINNESNTSSQRIKGLFHSISDVGFPSLGCEYVLLPLTNKEAALDL